MAVMLGLFAGRKAQSVFGSVIFCMFSVLAGTSMLCFWLLHSEPEHLRMMRDMDIDQSGAVNKSELVMYVKRLGVVHGSDRLPSTLHVEGDRLFDLADTDHSGHLSLNELSVLRRSDGYAKVMLTALDADNSSTVDRTEWLAHVESLVCNNLTAAAILDLYSRQVHANRSRSSTNTTDHSSWPLRTEAVRIFELADSNRNGQLDGREVSDMLRNYDEADVMVQIVDRDVSGSVSLDEWLAYIKRLADDDSMSTSVALRIYGDHSRQGKFHSSSSSLDFEADSVAAEVSKIFDRADQDKSGTLNVSELATLHSSPEYSTVVRRHGRGDP